MTYTLPAWRERLRWVGAHWPLLLEAAGAALLIEGGLRTRQVPRVMAWAGASPLREAATPAESPEAVLAVTREVALADSAARASRWACTLLPIPRTCLRESLVASRLLSRRGAAVQVRIGVRREADRLLSHAWLEDGVGRALTDPAGGYLPLQFRAHVRAVDRAAD